MIELINEWLANFTPELILGIAGLLGASIVAGITIYKKRNEKNFKFDWSRILDTIWQSTVVGVLSAQALGATVSGIIFAGLAGAGIDTIANKTMILNMINFAKTSLDKKKK